MRIAKTAASVAAAMMLVTCMAACGQSANTANTANSNQNATNSAATATAQLDLTGQRLQESDITTATIVDNAVDGEHVLSADGQQANLAQTKVTKAGNSSGDEADFYGENAAVFATNGATLDVSDTIVSTDGTHANGIFSYGEGTTVNVSHTLIKTSNNCSGGLMTTGGGTMNATDVTAETQGNSSAAIRSDRGGGTVNVSKGYFTTAGTGSPVVYSTADITVSDSYLESTASQGVVIEGKNSVTLNGCQLIASNTTHNSNKSSHFQAVMIYQSMSGDASVGQSSFAMTGGTLTNKSGDIFFVNNTACEINLDNAQITNQDETGAFLRAEAAGWGSEGSNGGKVNLNATGQVINGNIVVDDVSTVNAALSNGTAFTGAINPDGQQGQVYVQLDESSTWTLTADSYVSALSCKAGAINLNGHKLYVDGVEYAGADATGTAFEIASSSSSADGQGMGGSKPDGDGMGQGGSGGEGAGGAGGDKPDAKPDGDGSTGGSGQGGQGGEEPPAKPDGEGSGNSQGGGR